MKAARFVLLVADERACLAIPGGELIEAADDWRPIADALAADPHRPVRLVLDSAEQVYEQVTIRLRNPLDRRRLLGRKLAMLLPQAATTGLRQLAKGHYLLTAGGAKGALADVTALLAQTGNSLHDISFYPLEAGAYLTEQFPALGDGWSVVTLDSQLSGFRQLVLRHGRTIFSRLMPPALAPQAWQREIGTMLTYLPRLGLPRETPVALVANLDQAPLGTSEFPGATVGELFFLPANDRDFTGGFLHWHGQQATAQMPVGRRYWWLERCSQTALRAACCTTAIIALLGTAGIVHLHHRASNLAAQAAAEAGVQTRLAATMAQELASDGAATQLRLALALHAAAAKPASELPRVKAALATMPPALSLQEVLYQRAPFTVRANFAGDPLPQLPLLARQLPGLKVIAADTAIAVTGP